MIWEYSVALVAAAFVVLVIFLVKTLKAAEKSLNKTTQTLQEVQTTIQELSSEVQHIVKQASEVTGDLQYKMKQIDPVLESVKNVGDVLSEATLAAKQVSSAIVGRVKRGPKHAKTNDIRTGDASASHAAGNETAQHYSKSRDEAGVVRKPSGWVKWVDIAAGVWQKYRS